jgi:hypothetical protein
LFLAMSANPPAPVSALRRGPETSPEMSLQACPLKGLAKSVKHGSTAL